MRKLYHTFWGRCLIILSVAILVFAGCSDDKSTEAKSEPPVMPPVSSFQMDFNDFPLSNPKILATPGDVLSHDNWGWAALNVVFWQTLVTAGMAVPAAAFVESFTHEPEQQPNGIWIWSYDFSILGGVLHTASLHAEVDISGIQWEMYISKQNEFTDFLWYSGQSDLFATEGTWTLNYKPEDPTPWIGIEWHRNLQDSTADIKYSNIIPGDPENGGYIFYGTTTDTTYDAFYDIFNRERDNHTNIQWNRTTESGRVSDVWHFGDSDWRCWDPDLEDTECP